MVTDRATTHKDGAIRKGLSNSTDIHQGNPTL